MTDIREASEADIDRLLPLFHELERHYGVPEPTATPLARARLSEAFAHLPHGLFLIATDEGAPDNAPKSAPDGTLGFAILFEMFPGGDMQRMWYLKELYVAESARGRRLGEALMQAAARAVIERGGTRIEFTTGTDNKPAQAFYDRMGAETIPKVFYRYDNESLQRLAWLHEDDKGRAS